MKKIETLESNTEVINGEAVITETVRQKMTPQEVEMQISSIDMQMQQILQQVASLKLQYASYELQKTKYQEIKGQFPQDVDPFQVV